MCHASARHALVLILSITLFGGAGDAAADATSACFSHEIADVGRRVSGMAVCHAVAIAGAKPVNDACVERARARCCVEVPAAGCVSAAQQTANADAVETLVADLIAALPPGGTAAARRCAATKLRAAAKGAAATLGCHAKAARLARPLEASCLDVANAKLRKKWPHAEAHGACATTDDVDAIAGRIDEFLEAVRAAVTPIPGLGVYDVTFQVNQNGNFRAAVGTVSRYSDGNIVVVITFSIFDSLTLSGPEQLDGSLIVDGYFVDDGDIVHRVSGSARVSSSATEQRVVGTADIPDRGRLLDFTMTRPTTGTPPVFTGAYAFAFDGSPTGCGCSSSAMLSIDVPADGYASTLAGEDRDQMSTLLGTFTGGQCQVAPSGRTLCRIPYDAVDPNSAAGQCQDIIGQPCPVQLIGDLVAGPTNVSGAGQYLLGLAPYVFQQGDWTAVK